MHRRGEDAYPVFWRGRRGKSRAATAEVIATNGDQCSAAAADGRSAWTMAGEKKSCIRYIHCTTSLIGHRRGAEFDLIRSNITSHTYQLPDLTCSNDRKESSCPVPCSHTFESIKSGESAVSAVLLCGGLLVTGLDQLVAGFHHHCHPDDYPCSTPSRIDFHRGACTHDVGIYIRRPILLTSPSRLIHSALLSCL